MFSVITVCKIMPGSISSGWGKYILLANRINWQKWYIPWFIRIYPGQLAVLKSVSRHVSQFHAVVDSNVLRNVQYNNFPRRKILNWKFNQVEFELAKPILLGKQPEAEAEIADQTRCKTTIRILLPQRPAFMSITFSIINSNQPSFPNFRLFSFLYVNHTFTNWLNSTIAISELWQEANIASCKVFQLRYKLYYVQQ